MGLWSKQKATPYPRRMSLHGRTPCALYKNPYLLYLVLPTSSIRFTCAAQFLCRKPRPEPRSIALPAQDRKLSSVQAYGLAKVLTHGSTYGEPKVLPLGWSLSERQKGLIERDKKTPASVTVLIWRVELICPAGLTASAYKLGSLDLTIGITRSHNYDRSITAGETA